MYISQQKNDNVVHLKIRRYHSNIDDIDSSSPCVAKATKTSSATHRLIVSELITLRVAKATKTSSATHRLIVSELIALRDKGY